MQDVVTLTARGGAHCAVCTGSGDILRGNTSDGA